MKYAKTLAVAALLATSGLSHGASAEGLKFSPYVGVDLQRSVYSYNDNYDIGGGLVLDGNKVLEDGLNGANIHIGNQFNKYFGAELGYFRSLNEGKNIAAGTTVGNNTVAATDFKTNIKTQGFTLDDLGYLPIDQAEKFNLIGTVGATWTKAEVEIDGVSEDESELGFRAGAGAQYKLADNLNIRGLVRYQTADFDDVADRAWVYSAGLNYGF